MIYYQLSAISYQPSAVSFQLFSIVGDSFARHGVTSGESLR
jgi:hypothetical protein